MEKKILEQFILEKKSTREIAKCLDKSQTSIRHWLNKYKLKTAPEKSHQCRCGETNPNKFYGNKKRICGKCHNQQNIKRGKEKIERAIDYLGGRCSNLNCPGWKYKCSLDFHHLDPNEKDPNFSSKRGWSWEKLKKELDKCVLLCKNCHAALHNKEWSL